MKKILLMTLLLFGSCLTPKAEDSVLLPAMVSAWPGVRTDIEASGDSDLHTLNEFEDALFEGNKPYLRLVNWTPFDVMAQRGIVSYGYSQGVTQSLLERLDNFGEALLTLNRN
jgi:hypothetical protein